MPLKSMLYRLEIIWNRCYIYVKIIVTDIVKSLLEINKIIVTLAVKSMLKMVINHYYIRYTFMKSLLEIRINHYYNDNKIVVRNELKSLLRKLKNLCYIQF